MSTALKTLGCTDHCNNNNINNNGNNNYFYSTSKSIDVSYNKLIIYNMVITNLRMDEMS